jgi:hypothetical protein
MDVFSSNRISSVLRHRLVRDEFVRLRLAGSMDRLVDLVPLMTRYGRFLRE